MGKRFGPSQRASSAPLLPRRLDLHLLTTRTTQSVDASFEQRVARRLPQSTPLQPDANRIALE